MADVDERIRRKAYELWLAEGCPEGRHEFHWDEAREIIALEDAGGPPTIAVEKTLDEPVEPAVAFENQGEFPDLTDQGDNHPGPERIYASDGADDRPLAVDPDAAPKKTRARKAAAPAAKPAAAKKAAPSAKPAAAKKPAPASKASAPAKAAADPAAAKRRKPRANGAAADAG